MTERDDQDHTARRAKAAGRMTPREVEVLALAAAGLSDEEIGTRLRLSPRTVRFRFEKVFEKLGVRDRMQAVTIWSGSTTPSRKADLCPYPKPFSEGFADCPAYRATRVATLDIRHQPTGSIWTCLHLESRLNPRTEESWYPACAIGRPADRERWAAEVVGADRLAALNRVAGEIAAITWPGAERLWRLKQEQRREIQQGREGSEATRQMEAERDRVISGLDALLTRRRELLAGNGLSAYPCLDIARRAMNGFIAAHVSGDWSARLDVLLSLSEEAWPTAA